MASESKICPSCGEKIALADDWCRHCYFDFTGRNRPAPQLARQLMRDNSALGFGGMFAITLGIIMVAFGAHIFGGCVVASGSVLLIYAFASGNVKMLG